jgi:hypothetical protein
LKFRQTDNCLLWIKVVRLHLSLDKSFANSSIFSLPYTCVLSFPHQKLYATHLEMKGAFDAYKVITINRQKFVDRRTAVLGTDNGGGCNEMERWAAILRGIRAPQIEGTWTNGWFASKCWPCPDISRHPLLTQNIEVAEGVSAQSRSTMADHEAKLVFLSRSRSDRRGLSRTLKMLLGTVQKIVRFND